MLPRHRQLKPTLRTSGKKKSSRTTCIPEDPVSRAQSVVPETRSSRPGKPSEACDKHGYAHHTQCRRNRASFYNRVSPIRSSTGDGAWLIGQTKPSPLMPRLALFWGCESPESFSRSTTVGNASAKLTYWKCQTKHAILTTLYFFTTSRTTSQCLATEKMRN